MLANCCTKEAAVLDPKTLSWAPVGTGRRTSTTKRLDSASERKVLTVDAFNGINSELFDPATGAWSLAGTTVVQLVEPNSNELGPAVLRPDGTVFATGATGHNAIYDTATGMWSAGPDFPKVNGIFLDIADGPAALLPNGNVLAGARGSSSRHAFLRVRWHQPDSRGGYAELAQLLFV
jgi:hypothetical protein